MPGKTYWLGHRLADHEAEGGGDAELLCECELVTRPMLDDYLDRHPACLAGRPPARDPPRDGAVPGRRSARSGPPGSSANGRRAPAQAAVADLSDRAILGFLRERFKGTRPIAAGRQLQEQWMISGVYEGGLGVESLIERDAPQRPRRCPDAER